MDAWCIITVCAFSSPEAAILLVSTKNRNSGSERFFKHNGLRPEPIRFGRLDSEHAQSDGKSVNRGRPVLDHSRPQRPRSFWSATRIATSGLVQRHSVFEWLCKHSRLRPQPIKFVRLDSEHAQSDGKSVNRGLPVLDPARGRDSWFTAVKRLGMRVIQALPLHFQSLSRFITQNFHGQPPPLEPSRY